MAKRKASQMSDGGATQDRPKKASKGAARQAKSERRSKKKAQPKPARPEPAPLPEADETILPDTTEHTTDPFSSNNDVISLDDGTITTSKPPPPKANFSTLPASKKRKNKSNTTAKPETKAHRFILFIGNLPYSANTAAIEHHFRALQPFTIRHMTDKSTQKSRGTAFIEFPTYDHMKTCLKLYHHSLFDPDAHLTADPSQDENADKDQAFLTKVSRDEKSSKNDKKKDKTRRINVELTAGGGGAGQQRKNKLQVKNGKLAEQRERAHKKEAEEREKKRIEDGGRREGANGVAIGGGEGGEEERAGRGNVHPSRMRRVKG
jgi:nucleolar protein 6